jgi:hypothetical protein
MPTSQQEICWTTPLKPTTTSQQLTWRSTSSTCAEPGIPSSQWRPSSSRFKTALTIRRQESSPSVPRGRSTLGMQKIFATGHFMSACRRCNEEPAAEKTWTHFKSHFAAAHRQHKQMQGRWLKLPLALWQIWPHQPQRTEVWWQLLLNPTLVFSNNSMTLLQS